LLVGILSAKLFETFVYTSKYYDQRELYIFYIIL